MGPGRCDAGSVQNFSTSLVPTLTHGLLYVKVASLTLQYKFGANSHTWVAICESSITYMITTTTTTTNYLLLTTTYHHSLLQATTNCYYYLLPTTYDYLPSTTIATILLPPPLPLPLLTTTTITTSAGLGRKKQDGRNKTRWRCCQARLRLECTLYLNRKLTGQPVA